MKKLVVLLAAGKGRRMGGNTPKQYRTVCGKPLFLHSLQTFLRSDADEIAVVVAEGDEDYVKGLLPDLPPQKRVSVIAGGAERFHSVYRALCAFREQKIDIVSIHDSARPAITLDVIAKSTEDAVKYGASAVGVPSKDTVKLADPDGFVCETPNREDVYIIQTPQSFAFGMLLEAYDALMADEDLQRGVTDDAMVVEKVLRKKVKITRGEYSNIKVTTMEDIALAESFLAEQNANG